MPFLLGLISAQKLYLVGELYVGEAIAIAYILFNVTRLRLSSIEKTIAGFALLWATAQFISDLLNKTVIFDAIKGIFSPLVFAITFIFLMNYAKDKFERIPSLLIGILIGGLIQLLLVPTEYFIFNFWKWGVGGVVLGLFVVYFSFYLREKNNWFLFGALIIFSGITLYFDSRGMAIFPVLAAIAYGKYYGRKVSILSSLFAGRWTGFKLLLIALPGLFLINSAASALFSSEAFLSNFSHVSAAKYRTQATGTYGILLGGRSEVLVSAQAFLDKPLFGHGSWAQDKGGYIDKYSALIDKFGYSLLEEGSQEDDDVSRLIPSHSFLMGALVWAGVIGGLFWLIVLNSTLKIFVGNLHLFPLYYYVGMTGFVWNVFFSPFGADARWSTAVFLAAFFAFSNYLKSSTRVVL
jgi:hypothetical protein